MASKMDIEFFTNEELSDELAKRHEGLIISAQRLDGHYYCFRYGRPLILRGLLSHTIDMVTKSVRNWEKGNVISGE